MSHKVAVSVALLIALTGCISASPAPSPSPAHSPIGKLREAKPSEVAEVGDATRYVNCDAVRKAGAAPLRKGQPGYRPGLDRDHDGTACDK